MKHTLFIAFAIALFTLGLKTQSLACEFTPSVTANNIVDNGNGTFSFDVLMCIGETGSQNGPVIYMSDGINILSTSADELLNPNNGSVAMADISGGVITYSYSGAPMFWEPDDGVFGPCFSFTLTVDGDPSAATLSFENINDNCPNDINGGIWTTDIASGGACVVDQSVTAPAFFTGTTAGAGNDCDFRPSEDLTIEVEILCDGVYTFSTCDSSLWDTYIYLSLECCDALIVENDDLCGAQSEITSYLPAGTYYVTIEGFFDFNDGEFGLDIVEGEPLYKAETGPDQETCETTTIISANDPILGTGTWSVITGNGEIIDPDLSTTEVINLSNGLNQFVWTFADGPCTISSDTINVVAAGNLSIACPSDISVNNEPGECSAVVVYPDVIGTSECSTVTVTQMAGLGSGSTFPVGTTIEQYLVEDTLGNVDSCSFTITVVDVEPPTISCIDNFSVNNDEGECSALIDFTEPDGSDNCPGASTSLISGLASGSEFPVGITTNVYEVTDAAGNSNICTIEITVVDAEAPVFDNCPDDIVIEIADGECDFVVDYEVPTATDNCPGAVTINLISGLAPNSVFPAGTTTIVYEATDMENNTSICSFDITVNESVLPEIACPGNITVNNEPTLCSAEVNYLPPVGTDNCPGATTALIEGLGPGAAFPVGTTVEVWEVTDASGNTAECAFEITVEDIEDPEITCPGDISVNNDEGLCGAIVDFTAPEGSDNCTGFTVSLVSDLGPGDFFPVGITVVSYLVEDASGNVASCSFNVEVTDNEDPEPNCGDIVVDNDPGECHAVLDYDVPTATDNCDGTITGVLVSGQGPGATFDVGVEYEEIYSFTDATGNSTVCTITILVQDTEDPVLECPEDEVIVLDEADCTTILNYVIPTATDNCPGVVTNLISGPSPGTEVPAGDHTIVIGAEDANGNEVTCEFTITVVETVDPTISCPEDIVAYSGADTCGAVVIYVAPVGEDNCPGQETTQTGGLGTGAFFPVGVTTETWVVTDLSGNTATCSFTVTVLDTIAPTITCPDDIEVDANTGECTATVNYPEPTADDNCDEDLVFQLLEGLPSGSEFPVGINTIVYGVIDAEGNGGECSFTITVNGESQPTITCPDDIEIISNIDTCGAFVEYPLPEAEDACGGDVTIVLESGLESGSLFPVGTTVVVYTATNTFGNSASCSFEVTVVDDIAPEIVCPEDIELEADESTCEFIVDFDDPTATDNCGIESLTQTAGDPSGSTFGVGTHIITYEATDAFGNTVECSFNIIVSDDIDPTISECPEDITTNVDAQQCGAVVTYDAPTGDDNCDFTLELTDGLDSGSLFPVGETTVTWTVTDDFGNSVSCSFTVTVNDNIAPTITCPEDIETCNPIVQWNVDASDNCGVTNTEVTEGEPSGTELPIGTTAVTVVVSDAAGNTATCSFNITVLDNPDQADAGEQQLLCDRDSTQLQGNAPIAGVGMWDIISGNGTLVDSTDPQTWISSSDTGTVVLSWTIMGAGDCPSTTDTVIVVFGGSNSVDAGEDVTINGGESTDLLATAQTEGGSYEWSPSEGLSCTDCPNPVANPTSTTIYTVTYTTNLGCEYSDNVTVTVFNTLPNGFTPDRDGVNDVWNIPNVTADTEVKIYNRWGNLIFESTGYQEPWDGTYNDKPLPMGSFYYVIDYSDGSEPLNGTLTLIR